MKKKIILFSAIFILLISINDVFGQTTVVLQPDSVSGKDAFIYSVFPTVNSGTNRGLYSSGWTWSGVYSTLRSFVQFDLSSIPADAYIISAKLSLYNDPGNSIVLTNGEHSSLTASNASYISRVSEPWDESTITWNNQPGYHTANQIRLHESADPNQDYLDINVDEMVKKMVSNPTENYGFILRLQTEINYAVLIFGSSDNIDSTLHPKLEIVYSSTGVDNQDEPTVNLYPNPFNEEINIDLGKVQPNVIVTISNCIGQKLLVENFESTDIISIKLNVPKGVYFVKVETPFKELKMFKVLKE